MTFEFSYKAMVNWYDTNTKKEEEKNSNMVAFFIEHSKKYKSFNKKKEGVLDKFVRHYIPEKNISKLPFTTSHSNYFPNGIYYVKENEQNIYFVYPTHKTNVIGQEMMFADHISFPKKRSGIHLHLTTYVPNAADIQQGYISHLPSCHFKDNTQLPTLGYETSVFDDMGGFKDDVLDLCRAYIVQTQDGGTRTSLGTTKKIAKTKKNNLLEQKLRHQSISKVAAFGYKHEDEWHVTCSLHSVKDIADVAFLIQKPTLKAFEKELVKHIG